MEYENFAWGSLDEEEREEALQWSPPALHSQLRAAFRSCIELRVDADLDLGENCNLVTCNTDLETCDKCDEK